MKRRITLALTALVAIVTLVSLCAEIDIDSDEKIDFPFLGRVEAYFDLAAGHPKWHLYGLVHKDDLDKRKQNLTPYGIEVISEGCLVGGPTYKRHLVYNEITFAHLPIAAQDAILMKGDPASE